MSHVYVDPAGPNYRPPNLIEELTGFRARMSAVLEENRAHAGGFARMRDLSGNTDDRIYIPLPNADGRIADVKEIADHVSENVLRALRKCDPPLM